MNKTIKLKLIPIILLLLISGCIDSSVCGTYTLNGSVLIIQDDNTYIYTPATSHLTQKGTFTQRGNDLQLTSAFGTSATLKITAGGLIDGTELWKKEGLNAKFQNASLV